MNPDITETEAWQRGTEAAARLTKAPPGDAAKEREDKWRRIIAEINEHHANNCHTEPV